MLSYKGATWAIRMTSIFGKEPTTEASLWGSAFVGEFAKFAPPIERWIFGEAMLRLLPWTPSPIMLLIDYSLDPLAAFGHWIGARSNGFLRTPLAFLRLVLGNTPTRPIMSFA